MYPILECQFALNMRKSPLPPDLKIPTTLLESRKLFGCNGKIPSCSNCFMIRVKEFTNNKKEPKP